MTDEHRDPVRVRRGYWIRLARGAKGWTLKKLGHELGYVGDVTGNLSKWESGDRPVPSDAFMPLALALGLPARFLVKPPLTDRERLAAAMLDAADQELEDWDRAAELDREGDDGPNAGHGRRSA